MLAALLAGLAQALLGFLRGWLGDRRVGANAENLGAQKAAAETLKTIAETADARASLVPQPDDPDALARRLRDAARREAGAADAGR